MIETEFDSGVINNCKPIISSDYKQGGPWRRKHRLKLTSKFKYNQAINVEKNERSKMNLHDFTLSKKTSKLYKNINILIYELTKTIKQN